MLLADTITLDGVRRTADGYLTASAKVARTGIQLYSGAEVGKPEMASVRVYRPEAEVFSTDAMTSFAHRPVTLDHPKELVTAKTWRDQARGWTGDEVARDGEAIRVPLLLADAAAIDAVERGKRELSMGYTCDLKWEAGTTPSGEAYDAIQTNIRANHLAVVSAARGGPSLKIGDDGERSMTTKTVIVDGLSVETTDAGATAIEKLIKDRDADRKALADANTAHAKAMADKDAAHAKELATKDAALEAANKKVLSDADLDKRVQARANLITVAKAIAKDVKVDGLTDAAIRRAVVVAKLGDAAVKDKADAYVDARFEILAEDAVKNGGGDPFRDTVRDGLQSTGDADKAVSDAYSAMLKDMQSAHQPAKAAT